MIIITSFKSHWTTHQTESQQIDQIKFSVFSDRAKPVYSGKKLLRTEQGTNELNHVWPGGRNRTCANPAFTSQVNLCEHA